MISVYIKKHVLYGRMKIGTKRDFSFQIDQLVTVNLLVILVTFEFEQGSQESHRIIS